MTRHRKRLRRIEQPGHVRFLTFSCYRRLALFNNDAIKHAFVAQLTDVHERLGVALIAWVVMPEHIHLLLQPAPGQTVSDLLLAIKRPFAVKVLRRWRALNAPILERLRDARLKEHFWQAGGGYDRNIVGARELQEKIQYIHENPARRDLTQRAADWPWSSARFYLGRRDYVGPTISKLM